MKRLSHYFYLRNLQVTYNKHVYKAFNEVKISHLHSNTLFNSSKCFFFVYKFPSLYHYYKNYKNNAFSHQWCIMVPEIKDNVCTMQFGERLCRSSASAVRKRGISCPELRYNICHSVWPYCRPYKCNRCTEIFLVYNYQIKIEYLSLSNLPEIIDISLQKKCC